MATLKGRGIFTGPILILGFSESVSGMGNWITMMAVLALVVFRGDGGVLESGAIMMAGLLPVLLGSPLSGWLCDRYDRRKLMIASELLQALLVSVLIFTTSVGVVYPIVALEALAGSIMMPARRSVVPSLVSAQSLSRVNAFFQQLSGTIKIAAPLLAGGLLAIMNPHTAIIFDVASFLLSALLLSRLPELQPNGVPGSTKPGSKPERVDRTLRSLVSGSVGLRLIFVTVFLGIFVIVGFDVLASVFVRDSLHSGEGVFGLLVSLIGIGTVGSSILIMAGKRERNPWSDIVTGILLLSAIPLAFGISSFVPAGPVRTLVAIAGCLLGGAGSGLLNVQAGTLLQLLTPATMLGRTAGAFQTTATAGQLLGVLLTPALIPGVLSMTGYFIAAFVALSILVLWVLYNLRAVRASARARTEVAVG
ncbi:MAG TPA: MFS transporter [Spirochaetia bacterium]|nr:MFS transporter [Spirochaetia bacterium]